MKGVWEKALKEIQGAEGLGPGSLTTGKRVWYERKLQRKIVGEERGYGVKTRRVSESREAVPTGP